MLYWLGLIVATCFVPGYTGAIIPTQWAVLSILLPLGLWRSGALGPVALIGLAILAFGTLSIAWAPDRWDAGFGWWLLCLWALALWFGSTVHDFRPLWQGLAVGMWVSSAVAIFQWFGYTPVLSFAGGDHPSGLFFNSTLLGASACLVIIALITQRQWFYIPGVLPALLLAQSRGAFLVLVVTLLSLRLRLRYVICGMCAIAMILVFAINDPGSDSDLTRLTIWGASIRQLTFFGNGVGSFSTFLLFVNGNHFLYPGWVHNDYIQLWFEFGIGAIGFYCLYALALTQRRSGHWPIFFAFTLFGLFFFPLWTPLPAFMACMVAGAMLRDRYLDRLASSHGRYSSLPGLPRRVPLFAHLGRHPVPVPPST